MTQPSLPIDAPRRITEAMKADHLQREILWLQSLKNPSRHIPERIRVLQAVLRDYQAPDDAGPGAGGVK